MKVLQLKCPHRAKNFSYLLYSDNNKECAVVDPSFCDELLITKITEKKLQPRYIINTHPHHDHTFGNEAILNLFTKAQIVSFKPNDQFKDQTITVKDKDTLYIAEHPIQILHTPGHTQEDICLFFDGKLITGDVLFVGKVGGTVDKENAFIQFESLNRLMKLPGNTIVYPGHDYGDKPTTTIENEKENNPFCSRLTSFNDFYWLKENWKEFKTKHGLS
ncbi:hydroxyacylglutathione hydrolase family protein [Natranaerobius trueperi]|uniref:MBL fold metallo-hydrolase n=1 Tax=Natranaerobius trueperi TaxID=759412 RepID=A0A226BV93_9FIRM|nr:hydroxyacylglutathione hydrolase family protein [Natranaerobius trueperi]OWZ82916.1 MBL fold metallo-hydrolase [Natranaerobius trueperi]